MIATWLRPSKSLELSRPGASKARWAVSLVMADWGLVGMAELPSTTFILLFPPSTFDFTYASACTLSQSAYISAANSPSRAVQRSHTRIDNHPTKDLAEKVQKVLRRSLFISTLRV
jgi:hypothetical protein